MDSTDSTSHPAWDTIDALTRVRHHEHGSDVLAVELVFDNTVITLRSGPMDQLRITESTLDMSDQRPSPATWQPFIGWTVLWGWTLTNHLGLVDGYQLEFVDPHDATLRHTAQLTAVAGAIVTRHSPGGHHEPIP